MEIFFGLLFLIGGFAYGAPPGAQGGTATHRKKPNNTGHDGKEDINES